MLCSVSIVETVLAPNFVCTFRQTISQSSKVHPAICARNPIEIDHQSTPGSYFDFSEIVRMSQKNDSPLRDWLETSLTHCPHWEYVATLEFLLEYNFHFFVWRIHG